MIAQKCLTLDEACTAHVFSKYPIQYQLLIIWFYANIHFPSKTNKSESSTSVGFTQVAKYQGCLLDSWQFLHRDSEGGHPDQPAALQQLLDTQQVSPNTVTTCLHSPHPGYLHQRCPHLRRHPPGPQHGQDPSTAAGGGHSRWCGIKQHQGSWIYWDHQSTVYNIREVHWH